MTEDQIFRERIRNWVRAYSTNVRWSDASCFLSKYTDTWREEKFRDSGSFSTVDMKDAELLEQAWRGLEEKDKGLIRDWYVKNLSPGKVARQNAVFYRDVRNRVLIAERRFRVRVESMQSMRDKVAGAQR